MEIEPSKTALPTIREPLLKYADAACTEGRKELDPARPVEEKKVRWGDGTDGMLRLGAKTIPR
jgi:hypothetical protein